MTPTLGARTLACTQPPSKDRTVPSMHQTTLYEEDAELTETKRRARPAASAGERLGAVGPIGRLGRFAANHVRAVVVAWAVVAVALAAFAPKVETALSGAGWQANGSESVQARTLIQRSFAGLSSSALMVVVHSSRDTAASPTFRQTVTRVERILAADRRVASVRAPRPGTSISADGHTAIVMAGAKGDPTKMVAAADKLKSRLHATGAAGVTVVLTGASGMWSDFNSANR